MRRTPRIHVFLATSAIHREFKLKMDKDEIIARAVAGVKRADGYCDDVEFSPEDAARTELDFLCQVVEAAIEAGATTVNIPDTVGYATPAHYGSVIRTLEERVPNIDKAVISVHCHNDLGLAVANSLAGVENGAGQIECTINGIGERAGNCSLEEVVMAMRTRQRLLPLRHAASTRSGWCPPAGWSRTSPACRCSGTRRSSAATPSPTRRAFIRTACSRSARTYEIMRPEDVGLSARPTWCWASTAAGRRWPIGRKALGYHLTGEQLQTVFEEFKQLADKKKEVYDGDIAALSEHQILEVHETWALVSYEVTCGTVGKPKVRLTLRQGDKEFTEQMTAGDGPVDAIFLAIEKITGISVSCRDFRVHSVTVGKDAMGEVNVEVEHDGQVYRGRGVSTDSVEASALAFLNAINRVAAAAPGERLHPQHSV